MPTALRVLQPNCLVNFWNAESEMPQCKLSPGRMPPWPIHPVALLCLQHLTVTVLTVKHKLILQDCPELRDVRLKYFTASSLKDIFEIVDNQNIIGFIKDVHFYQYFIVAVKP